MKPCAIKTVISLSIFIFGALPFSETLAQGQFVNGNAGSSVNLGGNTATGGGSPNDKIMQRIPKVQPKVEDAIKKIGEMPDGAYGASPELIRKSNSEDSAMIANNNLNCQTKWNQASIKDMYAKPEVNQYECSTEFRNRKMNRIGQCVICFPSADEDCGNKYCIYYDRFEYRIPTVKINTATTFGFTNYFDKQSVAKWVAESEKADNELSKYMPQNIALLNTKVYNTLKHYEVPANSPAKVNKSAITSQTTKALAIIQAFRKAHPNSVYASPMAWEGYSRVLSETENLLTQVKLPQFEFAPHTGAGAVYVTDIDDRVLSISLAANQNYGVMFPKWFLPGNEFSGVRQNIATGKTKPIQHRAFFALKDTSNLALEDVGEIFPLTPRRRSVMTDNAFQSLAIMLATFPNRMSGDSAAMITGISGGGAGSPHWNDKKDRIMAIKPDALSVEAPGCMEFKDMVRVNTTFNMALAAEPRTGGQATFALSRMINGCYGLKGVDERFFGNHGVYWGFFIPEGPSDYGYGDLQPLS